MMQSTDEYTARIIDVVARELEIDPGEIGETDLLTHDHGADSMAMVGVLSALEKEFRVSIATDQLPRMTDIRGISEIIAEAASW